MFVLVIGVSVRFVVEASKLHLDHTPQWPPRLHHARGRYPDLSHDQAQIRRVMLSGLPFVLQHGCRLQPPCLVRQSSSCHCFGFPSGCGDRSEPENPCPTNDRFAAPTDSVRKSCFRTANRTLSEFNGKADKSRLMTSIGYARVSTGGQDSALQLDALRKAGCERLFEDKASGVKTDRPGLAEAIRYVRDGDTLTVWKLDRLGRSMKHLIEIITELEARGVGFRSITENIDTTTSGGRLVFHLFGALAQFERDLIRERTRAGLQAAEERGRRGGRQAVVTPEKLAKAHQYLAAGLNVREAAARVKIGKTALYEALRAEKLRNL